MQPHSKPSLPSQHASANFQAWQLVDGGAAIAAPPLWAGGSAGRGQLRASDNRLCMHRSPPTSNGVFQTVPFLGGSAV